MVFEESKLSKIYTKVFNPKNSVIKISIEILWRVNTIKNESSFLKIYDIFLELCTLLRT